MSSATTELTAAAIRVQSRIFPPPPAFSAQGIPIRPIDQEYGGPPSGATMGASAYSMERRLGLGPGWLQGVLRGSIVGFVVL
jgi:hypothetical protein